MVFRGSDVKFTNKELCMETALRLRIAILVVLVALCAFTPIAYAQTVGSQIPPDITGGVQIETKSTLYNQAYLEMADMLDGKAELSIKRAVFLAEWAYMDGKLNYDEYCRQIDSAVVFLNKFIIANGLQQYKTAKNMALIEYFFNPWSGNGYKPFIYDHNDIDSKEDFSQQFVSRVIQTHKGQCRSLPYYYKILAEAIGAEAYIAYAQIGRAHV